MKRRRSIILVNNPNTTKNKDFIDDLYSTFSEYIIKIKELPITYKDNKYHFRSDYHYIKITFKIPKKELLNYNRLMLIYAQTYNIILL